MTHSHMPIIKKGIIVSDFGAKSVEKYQKRFSKKKEQKLQRKLKRLQKRYDKLMAQGQPRLMKNRYNRRVKRLSMKIQAIEQVLGIQPFDQALMDQAQAEAMANMPDESDINPLLIGAGGLLVLGGLALLLFKK